jgi:hypothetical protein
MRYVGQNTANAGENSSETDDRMQSRNRLRELCWGDTSTDKGTNDTTDGCDHTKLSQDFWREAYCAQGSNDTGKNTQDSK